MITQKFEPTVKNSEKNSGAEITNDSLENDTSTPRANSERSAAIPEVKVETIETPASSPRVTKRAAKPVRPGKKQIQNKTVLLTFSFHTTLKFNVLITPCLEDTLSQLYFVPLQVDHQGQREEINEIAANLRPPR